jgi:hypothetical protein
MSCDFMWIARSLVVSGFDVQSNQMWSHHWKQAMMQNISFEPRRGTSVARICYSVLVPEPTATVGFQNSLLENTVD